MAAMSARDIRPLRRTSWTGEYEDEVQPAHPSRCSDEAVQELISYFANVSEDTAIIFGHHQPNVPSGGR